MILWYLYIAVVLQTGQPDVTFGYPFGTQTACEQFRARVETSLAAEVQRPAGGNAGAYKAWCQEVEVPSLAGLPKTDA